MFSFSFPFLFILIPIILVIWYIFFREKIGTIHPNPLISNHLKTPKKIWILWIIRSILIASIISILVWVYITRTVTTTKKIPQDIIIVFDVSLSMLAEDINPSRIEVARNVVRNFILSRSSDRIGLIIFAGKPFVSIPFSTDYNGIMNIINWLSPHLIRQDLPGLSGTNIGDALLLANMTHSGGKSLEKSIILVTDGRANLGIDPLISAQESRDNNIRIYPIGIGSMKNNPLYYTDSLGQKTYFYNESGEKLTGDLDESMMKNIAEIAQGKYFHADNRIELEQVFSDIGKNLPNKSEDTIETKSINLAPLFFIIFCIFLILDSIYMNSIMKKYRLF